MILTETTNVTDAALPLTGFQAHLRLGTGFGVETLQDEVLLAYLRASLAAVEARIAKVLLQRSFVWRTSRWGRATLPAAPVTAIHSIAIETADGTETVIDPGAYRLVKDTHTPILEPAGAALPTIPQGGAAVIAFDAGLATTWEALPADLRQAVMMLAAHYYEYRHDTALDARCMPFGASALLERYRMPRLAIGGRRL